MPLALAGCDLADKQEAQHDDSSNPYYKKAQQDLENNDAASAVGDYEAALGADPKLAGAHYELGILYSEKLNDPIGSIFHFKRYLELAPNSDKTDQVHALIDKQSQAFAASLPNSPTQSADDYAKLQSDNALLKKQVDDATNTITQLQAQLARESKHHHETAPMVAAAATAPQPPAPVVVADNNATSAPAPAATDPPATTNVVAAPPAPPRAMPVDTNAPDVNATSGPGAPATGGGPSRSYTVVKGDSLWKIAHKMYPHDTANGEDKIRDANKDVFNGKYLKPGQVLVIP